MLLRNVFPHSDDHFVIKIAHTGQKTTGSEEVHRLTTYASTKVCFYFIDYLSSKTDGLL